MKQKIFGRLISFAAAFCMMTTASVMCTEATAFAADSQSTDEPENALRFEVYVIDEETRQPIPNVTVRLEKRYFTELPSSGDHEYTGEVEVLETWNTSYAEVHLSVAYEYTPEKPYDVFAVAYDIPDGYNWYGEKTAYVWWNCLNVYSTLETGHIRLQKDKDADFPVVGTYTKNIRVVDVDTHELIPNLDCAVVNKSTGEEIYRWNTSQEPLAVVSGLEYRFEDQTLKNTIEYEVRFLNMPENYIVNYMGLKDYSPIYYWWSWYESGKTEHDEPIELYNTDPDAPRDPMIETTTPEETTSFTSSTTTTTTAATDITTTATSESESVTTTAATDITTTATSGSESVTTTTTTDAATTISESASITTTTAATNGTDTDLPQTGNNSKTNILIAVGALLLTAAGAWAVASSGILRRKEDEQ
ncbi:MAG: LPXTG cell wall anchor domain-containing protein [Oscillospiraceae bacterium]|nr:LPXTG cell wall anchor domain-containing protein [Oscillospiraceae bacterium]